MTEDISPLGPEGIVICEDCARTNRADLLLGDVARTLSAQLATLRAELAAAKERAASDKCYWDKTNGHLVEELAAKDKVLEYYGYAKFHDGGERARTALASRASGNGGRG